MLELIIKFIGAYLLGNLLGGEVAGALSGGINLRAVGSGNIGATNALRTQGKLFALAVLLIDIFKGVAAVTFVPAIQWHWAAPLYWDPIWQDYMCGLAVTLGHCYPLRHRFAGGKGVATLAGVYGALLPWSLPWLLGSFVLVILLTGYASLATLTASAMALFYVTCISGDGAWSPAGAFTLVMLLLVAWKHRDNIRRLVRGEESRFERARVLGRMADSWVQRWQSR